MYLSDKRRVELAIGARLLFSLVMADIFYGFDENGEVTPASDANNVAKLRELLKQACIEPVEDILGSPRAGKIMRRVERLHLEWFKENENGSAGRVGLSLIFWLRDLIDDERLILIEDSTFARAADIFLPMLEAAADNPAIKRSAEKSARRTHDFMRRNDLFV